MTNDFAMAPLLLLSEERIAAEVRQAEEEAALAAAWQRKVRRFTTRCLTAYAFGVHLAFSSMGLTGDAADLALWSGFLLGDGAILIFLLTVWAQDLE